MSAQPVEEYEPDPNDPHEILHVLPAKHHRFFLEDYTEAARAATQNPERYPQLRKVLRLWRLRAIAYSDPSYEADREAAREGRGDWTPIEQLVPDWPFNSLGRGVPAVQGSGGIAPTRPA